jgi:hypothetical protein
MNARHYKLEGHSVVPCATLLEWAQWAQWFELHTEDRIVAVDEHRGVRVSTVFLGLDHSFGRGPPLLFETMIFGGPRDQDMRRYSTWEDAERGHRELVAELFAEN